MNKGRGYVEAEMHPVDRSLPVDVVRIDAIYNPVRRANFTVAETRVGQRTDYDRLTVTVETNGTITPEDAIAYAAALWPRSTSATSSSSARCRPCATRGSRRAGGGAGVSRQRLGRPIDDFGLSVRSLNSLKNSNIRTLGDLVEFTEDDLLKVKNVGEKALGEIAELLQREGLNFGMGFEETTGELRIVRAGSAADGAAVDRARERRSNAASRQGPPALPDLESQAGDAEQHGDQPVPARRGRSRPRPRPRSCGRSPSGSSRWRAAAICTPAGWSGGGSRIATILGRLFTEIGPRFAAVRAATPGSSSWGTASATARRRPGSSCSPSDRTRSGTVAADKTKGTLGSPFFQRQRPRRRCGRYRLELAFLIRLLFMHWVQTRIACGAPSTRTRTVWRFGYQRRLLRLLAWLTLFPVIGPLPHTAQTRAISSIPIVMFVTLESP